MLKLTRKIGERVTIRTPTGDIRVTTLASNGNQIKLGFDAPKEITIHRDEIWERIKHKEVDNED